MVLHELMNQDLEPDPEGSGQRIVQGVAEDRRISVEDEQMRHGRKSKRRRIDGYKRHVAEGAVSTAAPATTAGAVKDPIWTPTVS